MARRPMTAKQKAALRKAQLASARKRKGKGKGGRARRAGREIKRRYQAGHTGPGAQFRRQADYYHSRGYYSTRSGGSKKKPIRGQRTARKINTALRASNYGGAAVLGVSYARNKRAMKYKAAGSKRNGKKMR